MAISEGLHDANTSEAQSSPSSFSAATSEACAPDPDAGSKPDETWHLPSGLRQTWAAFLGRLWDRGFFEEHSTQPRHIALAAKRDIKKALQQLGRTRPDILMQLPTHPLLQLAQWPLPPSDKPERKTVEADKRLKAYCAGDADLSLPASTLDVLRVIWAWTSKPDAAVAAVPGISSVIHTLLQDILKAELQPADPAVVKAAAAESADGVTQDATSSSSSNHSSSPDEHQPKSELGRRFAAQHRRRLLKIVRFREVREGDWFCNQCGEHNWAATPNCYRCRIPQHSLGNSVVSKADMQELDRLGLQSTKNAVSQTSSRFASGARSGTRSKVVDDGDDDDDDDDEYVEYDDKDEVRQPGQASKGRNSLGPDPHSWDDAIRAAKLRQKAMTNSDVQGPRSQSAHTTADPSQRRKLFDREQYDSITDNVNMSGAGQAASAGKRTDKRENANKRQPMDDASDAADEWGYKRTKAPKHAASNTGGSSWEQGIVQDTDSSRGEASLRFGRQAVNKVTGSGRDQVNEMQSRSWPVSSDSRGGRTRDNKGPVPLFPEGRRGTAERGSTASSSRYRQRYNDMQDYSDDDDSGRVPKGWEGWEAAPSAQPRLSNTVSSGHRSKPQQQEQQHDKAYSPANAARDYLSGSSKRNWGGSQPDASNMAGAGPSSDSRGSDSSDNTKTWRIIGTTDDDGNDATTEQQRSSRWTTDRQRDSGSREGMARGQRRRASLSDGYDGSAYGDDFDTDEPDEIDHYLSRLASKQSTGFDGRGSLQRESSRGRSSRPTSSRSSRSGADSGRRTAQADTSRRRSESAESSPSWTKMLKSKHMHEEG
eukprot:jgi/Chrzof1/12001/Cz06g17200.t1